jgi:hypothetical protein
LNLVKKLLRMAIQRNFQALLRLNNRILPMIATFLKSERSVRELILILEKEVNLELGIWNALVDANSTAAQTALNTEDTISMSY